MMSSVSIGDDVSKHLAAFMRPQTVLRKPPMRCERINFLGNLKFPYHKLSLASNSSTNNENMVSNADSSANMWHTCTQRGGLGKNGVIQHPADARVSPSIHGVNISLHGVLP